MAISKEVLNNKKKNKPEALGTVPANNPEHRSAPIDMHHPIPPKPVLYNSFDEAKDACGLIFLKPGEAHTEFYKIGKEYHCVVAIGNINPGYGHLYLTDSGSQSSITDQLTVMNASVNWVYNQVQVLNASVRNINASFIEVKNLFNQFKIEVTNEIQSFIETVNREIVEINNKVNAINTSTATAINEFEEYVNNKVAELSALVNTYNNRIAELESWHQVVDVSLAILDEKIQTESNINAIQNVSINLLKQVSDNLQQQIIDLSLNTDLVVNKVEQHIESSINAVEQHIDSSILELKDLINVFEPISNPSIDSLFHDDIYTVNLCCYTAGGYIKIFDDVSGGVNTRVAECTPENEYKTYVNGDDVSFMAIANEGYKFVCWYIDGIKDTSNPVINTTFVDKDIPVIGTLANGLEPNILNHGYTALFERLHRLTVTINCNTNDPSISPAYLNDSLSIKVNGKDVSIEDALAGHVYYDANTTIKLTAIPDIEGHHEFDKFIIRKNPVTYNVVTTSPHTIYNVNTDLYIEADFMEYWIYVHADVIPTEYGRIICPNPSTGVEKPYIHGSNIYMYVSNIAEGWVFDKWADEHISDASLSNYITPSLNSSAITLHVDKAIESYQLTALLKEEN